jgi:hypothetical protein
MDPRRAPGDAIPPIKDQGSGRVGDQHCGHECAVVQTDVRDESGIPDSRESASKLLAVGPVLKLRLFHISSLTGGCVIFLDAFSALIAENSHLRHETACNSPIRTHFVQHAATNRAQ